MDRRRRIHTLLLGIWACCATSIAFATSTWTSGVYENNTDVHEILILEGVSEEAETELFIEGEVENNYDYVSVYRVVGGKKHLVETYTGSIRERIALEGNTVIVRLQSDYSVVKSGITATFKKKESKHIQAKSVEVDTFIKAQTISTVSIAAAGTMTAETIHATNTLTAQSITTDHISSHHNAILTLLDTPIIREFSFSGHQIFDVDFPDITVPVKALLADVFVTIHDNDHNNIVLGKSATGQQNWVYNRGGRPSAEFGYLARQAVTLTYNGETDGFSPYYGMWYSSQIIPVKDNGNIAFGNYSNSGSNGWIYIRVRGIYR